MLVCVHAWVLFVYLYINSIREPKSQVGKSIEYTIQSIVELKNLKKESVSGGHYLQSVVELCGATGTLFPPSASQIDSYLSNIQRYFNVTKFTTASVFTDVTEQTLYTSSLEAPFFFIDNRIPFFDKLIKSLWKRNFLSKRRAKSKYRVCVKHASALCFLGKKNST